jgi:hypothetical protein
VEIRAGPMQVVRGTVVRVRDEEKLVLSVECLGKALMTIGTIEVKPVSGPAAGEER